MTEHRLVRQTTTTSRELEFFSERELVTQTGCSLNEWWPRALAKELYDNCLDALETSGSTSGRLSVTLDDDALVVSDNGPGIPPDVVERILDFSSRTSDKSSHVGPTRGQQGNATLTLFGIAYVLNNGNPATVEIEAHEIKHRITVWVDHVTGRPTTKHERLPIVKNEGTTVRIPRFRPCSKNEYGGRDEANFLLDLTADYSLFNPHVSFDLCLWKKQYGFAATNPNYEKWWPTDPPSPHWYTIENLQTTMAAYIANERAKGQQRRTVWEFASEFRGLKGSLKRRDVIAEADLKGVYAEELVGAEGFDQVALGRLLAAMKNASAPVKPDALGVLGEDHFRAHLDGTSAFRYKSVKGEVDGLPFVVEAAFGITDEDDEYCLQGQHIGLNFSVPLSNPLQDSDEYAGLSALLASHYVDEEDGVCLVLHLTSARFDFRDRGKGSVILRPAFFAAVETAVLEVTKPWAKMKKQKERDAEQAERSLHRLVHGHKNRITTKAAAWSVMVAAFMEVSSNAVYSGQPRQVMYKARGPIQDQTGKPLNDEYFTQGLFPDFVEANPVLTANWIIEWDARGHFTEPHTDFSIGIGTREVKGYRAARHRNASARLMLPRLVTQFPTCGPHNRFGAVLYIEKEGFLDLLETERFAERFDLAIASSKGMGTTAARTLLEELAEEVPIYVVHDFDKSGFSIVGTLRRDTRRYKFTSDTSGIVDLGLRLDDVQEWGLESETVVYNKNEKDPRSNLALNGATPQEIAFLVRERIRQSDGSLRFKGQRVELNAFTSKQFIDWLDVKLTKLQVAKVIPDAETLKIAYKRATGIAFMQEMLRANLAGVQKRVDAVNAPRSLRRRVMDELKAGGTEAWDEVIARLAAEDQKKR